MNLFGSQRNQQTDPPQPTPPAEPGPGTPPPASAEPVVPRPAPTPTPLPPSISAAPAPSPTPAPIAEAAPADSGDSQTDSMGEDAASPEPDPLMQEAFPMIAVINEQVDSSIPPELVERVKNAPSKRSIISSTYPYPKMMKGTAYDKEVNLLQIELVKMQAWVTKSGERIVSIFEGRDAAGKGGTIQRFTENLNPRGARVVALAKPTETEKGQWYFQRYVEEMPTKGEIVFFDRSWYNRAGVEHVMGFCSPHEYLEFMRQAPEFERMLVRSDIRMFKFWFSVSREEQLRRFLGRAQDPLKQWKLSPMDVESLGRWEEYTKAKEAMLFYTDTADAPWTIVRSDDKKRARLNAMKYLLHSIPYKGKDEALVSDIDPLIVGSAKEIYEHGEQEHTSAIAGAPV